MTPIYIDKNGTEDGIAVAATLSALRFSNPHLTTAERMADVKLPPGTRSVIEKRFPARVTVA